MKVLFLAFALAGIFFALPAKAYTTECKEITSIPMKITAQGVYCLKQNLVSSVRFGTMIEIQANNVTIDLNGFKLGGFGGSNIPLATAIRAHNQNNITVRNGTIRGFRLGISITQEKFTSSGHLIENMLLDRIGGIGIKIEGLGFIVRDNRVVKTGRNDLDASATGISVTEATGSIVTGNLVSMTTTNKHRARGILVWGSSVVEVRGNSILNSFGSNYDSGITVSGSGDVTIIDNRILNAAGAGAGDAGIAVEGTLSGINCIDNTIAGFVTATLACNFESGNNTP